MQAAVDTVLSPCALGDWGFFLFFEKRGNVVYHNQRVTTGEGCCAFQ